MGWTAAQMLVNRIQSPEESYPDAIWFEPELVVRESTAGVREERPGKPRRDKL
jgi:LacI family transcriptional regulator